MNHLVTIHLLAAYSCDAYGANAYGECSTTAGQAGSSNNLLASTGFDILLPLALGISIVIASVILLIKRIRRSKQSKQD